MTRPHLSLTTAAMVVVIACGLAAIVFFDVGVNLAFDDDWGMAWSAQHFPHIQPAQSALALVQDGWAALVTGGGHDRRLLRLTQLPWFLAALLGLYGLARQLGATREWALTAPLALLAFPVAAALATSF